MTTGAGAYDVFKPKLAWFNFADSFLRKNIDDESSVVRYLWLFVVRVVQINGLVKIVMYNYTIEGGRRG